MELHKIDERVLLNGDRIISILCYPTSCKESYPDECALNIQYVLKSNTWTIKTIAPFYPEVEVMDIDSDGQNELSVSLMDCDYGKCIWYNELYKLQADLLFKSIYLNNSFSDLNYLQFLIREQNKLMNIYVPGDTIENLVSINFVDVEGSNGMDILEEESIQLFKEIRSDTLVTDQFLRTNTLKLLPQGYQYFKEGEFKKSVQFYY